MAQADDQPPDHDPLTGVRASSQIDHLLRTAKLQITEMTKMADQKASIMTGLAVVMLSIIFGYVQAHGPSATLAVFAVAVLAAAMTAIIAVVPTVKKPGPKIRLNPLFFGHIVTMTEDRFVDLMADALRSESRSYEMLVRDIYQLSTVVTRKYALVALSYKILVIGFVLSGGTFAAELVWKHAAP
ncbi:hypothetical protein BH23VER1_BH23VER1_10770 [soil metagenome]